MDSCEKISNQKPLMVSRRFAPLFWRHFFAAFDDNFFKAALALFILAHVGGERGAATATLMAPETSSSRRSAASSRATSLHRRRRNYLWNRLFPDEVDKWIVFG